MSDGPDPAAEGHRLAGDHAAWMRWGPYLAERAWGTVREDYSPDGAAWEYLPHEHARSVAYRWNEDGMAGVCDERQRLCLALALWNGHDPILKERMFGLAGPEGNHGEDVKEYWWYTDAVPSHAWLRWQYAYPLDGYPYTELVAENARRRDRGRADPRASEPEYELLDTGVFDPQPDGGARWADVTVEVAKAAPDDLVVRIRVENMSAAPASVHVLPTLWFRNTWSWRPGAAVPALSWRQGAVRVDHPDLPPMVLAAGPGPGTAAEPVPLFCDNETNTRRRYGTPGPAFPKDGINDHVVLGAATVNPALTGTKAALWYRLELAGYEVAEVVVRLAETGTRAGAGAEDLPDTGEQARAVLSARLAEADAFHAALVPPGATTAERLVARQAVAGLVWSKQFYRYDVGAWLDGDPAFPPPPAERLNGRNSGWRHVDNADVLSMPDPWEYPWYAAWDLAFHTVAWARVDPQFAKQQLLLLLREWYLHPNGQLPAYEWAFGDVNPPVHAWAALRVFELDGGTDHDFLERVLHKLLLNFTWWVNRKDAEGNNIFEGGFLGMDNIGPIDRSHQVPDGATLEQSDATAWMAMFCLDLLAICLELGARHDPVYQDLATKFLEHFAYVATAMRDSRLWDEQDGFYYDALSVGGRTQQLRVQSMVGLVPLFAVRILPAEVLAATPDFAAHLRRFLADRPGYAAAVTGDDPLPAGGAGPDGSHLLAIIDLPRLGRILARVLDEQQFLSPHGIRSLSRAHRDNPFVLDLGGGTTAAVDYEPAESTSGLFGGNSNWRGPVWFPVNHLLVESLRRYAGWPAGLPRRSCRPAAGRAFRWPPRRTRSPPGWWRSSCRTPRGCAPWCARAMTGCLPAGARGSPSTSTSTATPAPGWAPPTRRGGRPWCSTRSSSSPLAVPADRPSATRVARLKPGRRRGDTPRVAPPRRLAPGGCRRPLAAAAALLAGVGAIGLPRAAAGFTAVATNAGSTWSAVAPFPDYPAAATANGPWAYYRGEEAPSAAAARSAVDSSGNSHPGTYHGTTDGPSTWWTLDEGAGTAVEDSSGAANPGTLTGLCGWGAGMMGGALTLDGTSCAVAGSGPAVRTASSFSVAAWVRLDADTGSDQAAVSQAGVHTAAFTLGFDAAGGTWAFSVAGSDAAAPAAVTVRSTDLVTPGRWAALAGVYTASSGQISLYVDGALIGSAPWSSSWDATGVLEVGRARANDAEAEYFDGMVDDVRVYGRALSAAEAAALARDPARVHWSFSEGTGTSTADTGSAADTGTLAGGASWAGPAGGHTGDAVAFGGTGGNGYVDGAGPAVHTDADFSVSAWVYLDPAAGLDADRVAVSQAGSTVSGFSLQFWAATGGWAFALPGADSDPAADAPDVVVSTTAAATGTWVHLVGVYDHGAGTLTLYVDGTPQGSSVAHPSNWDAAGVLEVGRARHTGVGAKPWYGKVDDVEVFQRALAGDDVKPLRGGVQPSTTVRADMTAGIIGALQGSQQGLQSSTAIAFAGSAGASYDSSVIGPPTFTVECWVRSSEPTGGAIAGFSASASGYTTVNDRVIYLDSAGRLTFGTKPASTPLTVASQLSYTDGRWHFLAASLGAAGLRLYVDGALVAANAAVTTAGAYTGYARWGGLPLTGWPNRPHNDYLVGSIDELAVYTTQLSDAQVAEQYHTDH